MGQKKHSRNNSSKGHKALSKTHDTSVQSGPYKLGHSDAYETLQVSPWPVPELTGVQWVKPLPQASYKSSVGDKVSCSLPKVYLYILWSTCVYKPLRDN